MPKFTFTCQEEPMPFSDSISSKRTVEFTAETLSQIIPEFENFLRGCGYFFEGELDFIDDEKYEPEEINFNFDNISKNNWPFGELKPQPENTSER